MSTPEMIPGPLYAEIPDRQVKAAAHDFRNTVQWLWHNGQKMPRVAPLFMNAGFALGLYLKAMNAKKVYQARSTIHNGAKIDMGETIHAMSETSGHSLLHLFKELRPEIRADLEARYAKDLPVSRLNTLKDVLKQYDNLFLDSRYYYEDTGRGFLGSPDDLVHFVDWLGRCVEAMPLQNYFLPPKYQGQVSNGQILLSSPDLLPDGMIVEVEFDDDPDRDDRGMVESGIIKLRRAGDLSDGMIVSITPVGPTPRDDEVDPIFRVEEYMIPVESSEAAELVDGARTDYPQAGC